MNKSFLLTSNKHFEGSAYLIPSEMRFSGIRLKSAIINFSEQNVVGHQLSIRTSDVSSEVPTSSAQTFSIADGAYTPEQYAATVQNVLNKVKNPDVGESGSLIADNLYSVVDWDVLYNSGSGKLEVSAHIKYNYEKNVYLTFNQQMSDYIGEDFGTYMQWHRYGVEEVIRTTPRVVLQLPRFYRVCSNTLSQFGFSYDNSMGSNILGVVPIDHSKKWTSWENNDSFFHSRFANDLRIGQLMDIEIFLEESVAPISLPDFVLVFQIQS